MDQIAFNIRKMCPPDREAVLFMMETFYRSDAVYTNGSAEIFARDFEECLKEPSLLDGYVFEKDGKILGYGMLAHGFSTEFARPVIWIEDLYVLPDHRSKGIGARFLKFAEKANPGALLRLEVEKENRHACHVYEKAGFDVLPYVEMKKLLR